jgi:hypothetical protein
LCCLPIVLLLLVLLPTGVIRVYAFPSENDHDTQADLWRHWDDAYWTSLYIVAGVWGGLFCLVVTLKLWFCCCRRRKPEP